MIFLSAALFAWGALRVSASRGYLTLMAALFLCMFIRENDRVFDTVWHRFWLVPALVVAAAGVFLARRNRGTTIAGWLAHARHGSFWVVMVGLIQLLIFSRLFGSGELWENVSDISNPNVVKTVVQEGIELVSYAILLLGSWLSSAARFGAKDSAIGIRTHSLGARVCGLRSEAIEWIRKGKALHKPIHRASICGS